MDNGEMSDKPIGKFEKCVHLLSGCFGWVGFAGGLVMMFITAVDVIAAKVFASPIPGTIEIVMLSQVVAIAFVAPLTQIIGNHVRVEFFLTYLPKRTQAIISSIVDLLLILFFILIVWRLYAYGNSLRAGGQVSSTAEIAIYPFAYGAAAAMMVVCFALILEFIKSALGAIKR
jgi:TRAP-type C4-dicarboxylate transport system permease small subunit